MSPTNIDGQPGEFVLNEAEVAFLHSDVMEGARLVIGIPTNHPVTHTDFWMSLIFQRIPPGMHISYKVSGSKSVGYMRNQICDYALKTDATHVIMFDTDMLYPLNSICRHLMHMETDHAGLDERPRVINAFSLTKMLEHSPLYFPTEFTESFDKMGRFWPTDTGMRDGCPVNGLQRVWMCGGAALAIKTDVLMEIRIDHPERPFFFDQGRMTEDVIFGRSCMESGIPMYTDVEMHVAHVGSFAVNPVYLPDEGGWCAMYYNTPPTVGKDMEEGEDLMSGYTD